MGNTSCREERGAGQPCGAEGGRRLHNYAIQLMACAASGRAGAGGQSPCWERGTFRVVPDQYPRDIAAKRPRDAALWRANTAVLCSI